MDDLRVKAVCGPKLEVDWSTANLSDGKHVIDVVATTAQGKQSRRRFDVYAGFTYLLDLGATFDEQAQRARVTLRNLADPAGGGSVGFEMWSLSEKDDKPVAKVYATTRKPELGAMQLDWDGQATGGKMAARGRYLAKVVYLDARGAAKQSESAAFLFDSEQVQRKTLGEVEGA